MGLIESRQLREQGPQEGGMGSTQNGWERLSDYLGEEHGRQRQQSATALGEAASTFLLLLPLA